MEGKHKHSHQHAHEHKHEHKPGPDEAHAHGHHHADAHAHQPQRKPGEEGSPLARKEKLIIRLEHDIRHNSQHADASLNLANEAGQIGEEEAARLIRAAAESAARIHEDLQKALSVLKSG